MSSASYPIAMLAIIVGVCPALAQDCRTYYRGNSEFRIENDGRQFNLLTNGEYAATYLDMSCGTNIPYRCIVNARDRREVYSYEFVESGLIIDQDKFWQSAC